MANRKIEIEIWDDVLYDEEEFQDYILHVKSQLKNWCPFTYHMEVDGESYAHG